MTEKHRAAGVGASTAPQTNERSSQGHDTTTPRRSQEGIAALDHQGRQVGTIRDGTLRKTVYKSRHFLSKYQTWALDCCTVDQCVAEGVQRIELHDAEEDVTYTATLDDFRRYSWAINFPGHGPQRGLRVGHWTRSTDKPKAEPAGDAPKAMQLAFDFGGAL